MDFYNWLLGSKKLSHASASKYDLVIKNRIVEWLPSYEVPNNFIEYEALRQLIVSLDIYQERNKVGNNMYSSALKHYGEYLKEVDQTQNIFFDENSCLTAEAEKLVKVRLSQTKFRKDLFDLQGCCAISGMSNSQFLVASHIKPWSKSNDREKNDPFNGFLLTPNFDRLFDRGFITFEFSGRILLSKKLTIEESKYFDVPEKVRIKLYPQYEQYLDYHQKSIFQG